MTPLTELQADQGWCCREECCGPGSWCCAHANADHRCDGDRRERRHSLYGVNGTYTSAEIVVLFSCMGIVLLALLGLAS